MHASLLAAIALALPPAPPSNEVSPVAWCANDARGGPEVPGVDSPDGETKKSLGPVHYCFAPGTPPEVMQRAHDAMFKAWQQQNQDDFGERFFLGGRWSGAGFGSQGDPIELTYSFVPDFLMIPGANGEPNSVSFLFTMMDSAFGGFALRPIWMLQFTQAFNRWSELSGVNYTRITYNGNDWDDGAAWGADYQAGRRGHIRIGMHPIDGEGNILAYNYYPNNGDMVLDMNDISRFANPEDGWRYLRDMVSHETGHGLGIAHVCSSNSMQLMEPSINTDIDGPQQDDIRAVQRNYGDPNEPDNTPAQAHHVGNLGLNTISIGPITNNPVPFGSTLSIDANGEVDCFRVTCPQPVLANLSAIPVGFPYESAQQSDGSCTTGSNVQSQAIANLAVRVFAADGTTEILRAEGAGLGLTETLSNVLLSPPGDFHVQIYETNAPGETQLYYAQFAGTLVPTLSATDGTFNDRVSLSWTAIPGSAGYRLYRNTSTNRATAVLIASPSNNAFDDATVAHTTTYYYWVEAIQGGGGPRPVAGPEAGHRTQGPIPGSFNLVAPANGESDVSPTPTLKWTNSSNVSTYTVMLDNDSDFTSPIINVGGLTETSYEVAAGLLDSGCNTYYWRVRAFNSNGTRDSTPYPAKFFTISAADFDGDGFVTGTDFDLYVAAFESGDASSDFDGDGFITGADYDAYVQEFENPC